MRPRGRLDVRRRGKRLTGLTADDVLILRRRAPSSSSSSSVGPSARPFASRFASRVVQSSRVRAPASSSAARTFGTSFPFRAFASLLALATSSSRRRASASSRFPARRALFFLLLLRACLGSAAVAARDALDGAFVGVFRVVAGAPPRPSARRSSANATAPTTASGTKRFVDAASSRVVARRRDASERAPRASRRVDARAMRARGARDAARRRFGVAQ